jgi:hypothetical protein
MDWFFSKLPVKEGEKLLGIFEDLGWWVEYISSYQSDVMSGKSGTERSDHIQYPAELFSYKIAPKPGESTFFLASTSARLPLMTTITYCHFATSLPAQ